MSHRIQNILSIIGIVIVFILAALPVAR